MTDVAFRQAVEAHDFDALRRSLAPDMVFHTPIRFTPFVGRDEVSAILRIPAEVFAFGDAFRHTPVPGHDRDHVLFFEGEMSRTT